jgi:hypothetical protein
MTREPLKPPVDPDPARTPLPPSPEDPHTPQEKVLGSADDSPLESIGKAIVAPVEGAAEEEENRTLPPARRA